MNQTYASMLRITEKCRNNTLVVVAQQQQKQVFHLPCKTEKQK